MTPATFAPPLHALQPRPAKRENRPPHRSRRRGGFHIRPRAPAPPQTGPIWNRPLQGFVVRRGARLPAAPRRLPHPFIPHKNRPACRKSTTGRFSVSFSGCFTAGPARGAGGGCGCRSSRARRRSCPPCTQASLRGRRAAPASAGTCAAG